MSTNELNAKTAQWCTPSIYFSTDNYPKAERFSAWKDEYSSRFSNRELTRLPGDTIPFFRRMTSYQLGEINFACFEGSPLRSSRTQHHLADGNDDFVFLVNRHGTMQVTQWTPTGTTVNSQIVMAQDGACMTSNAKVSEAIYNCSEKNCGSLYAISIPRRVLVPLVCDADSQLVSCNNYQRPLLQSISRCGQELLEGTLDPSFSCAESIGNYLLDLITMILGPTHDAKEMADKRSVRNARLARLLEYVGHSFMTRELQVSHAAGYLGTTERYVQQLLEKHGKTFTELVQENRLNAAAKWLSQCHTHSPCIGDIATQCGFNNVTYFNRIFKQRFAITPREYRIQQHATSY